MTKLRVVATPIGNIDDMSPRAAAALRDADIVLCEDTRHSAPLVKRTGSRARLVSCHAHNERERAADVVAALERNESVALISDAGAPAVSDPGGRIVEAVVAAGLEVEVLPGPSALVAALMGAGVDAARFSFLGFLPQRAQARRALVEGAARAGMAIVLYEAPQRTQQTLAELATLLGARRVVVARELTKLHETFHRGVLGGALSPPFVEKGEVVVVVEAGEAGSAEHIDVDAVARDDSLPPKERARRIAQATGVSVKEAYARVQQAGRSPRDAVARALALLADAARALAEADALARTERGAPPRVPRELPVPSDIEGADTLMDLLASQTALPAPVEARAAAEALLTALERLDTLHDAM